jgi:hypothetical protein
MQTVVSSRTKKKKKNTNVMDLFLSQAEESCNISLFHKINSWTGNKNWS